MDTPSQPRTETLMGQIRGARRARRKTQADVAEHLRISRQQYTAIEMGRSTPSAEQLRGMCRAIGVTVVFDPRGNVEVRE